MAKVNARLDAARKIYREALDAARANPSPEAWARLLQAGKDLSAAEEPKQARAGRRARRAATPSYHDLEGRAPAEPTELADPVDLPGPVEPPGAAAEPHEFEQVD